MGSDWNVLATFSSFERRLIGQRTREAMAVKKLKGSVWAGGTLSQDLWTGSFPKRRLE
jgi:DNA invertase Pin-like site-specific DNA recombinase